MNPVLTIAKKRDGRPLDAAEIGEFLQGFARGEVPDYQMSALAMAIYLRGMNGEETRALTDEMLRSGATLAWTTGGPAKVDKHSTGGIGDKTSLVLAPLLACCGLQVPMLSGRGLGATGGTLDKLEAIPGFRTDLSVVEIRRIVESVGCVITGTTADLAPADRKLYALRDVTGTVASIPLITASIMSKKLAENLSALVLDVKYGSGAFMKTLDEARRLAESLVETGRRMQVRTTALLTDMNQPLGRMIGNAVEVNEAVDSLAGRGPDDLWEVTAALGVELLLSAGKAGSAEEARATLDQQIASGRASAKFREMVSAQGGDLDAARPVAPAWEWCAPPAAGGHLAAIDAERLGLAVIEMGGGRKVLSDRIDHAVGFEMLARIGDRVESGQPLVRVFGPSSGTANADAVRRTVQAFLNEAFQFAVERPQPPPLIAAAMGHAAEPP